MSVRLRLLGPPALEHEREVHPLPFERRSQLLAYLALRRTWVGRTELAALFWPDQPEKLAYANLRKTLFRLRSLPWSPEVEVQGGALRYEVATDAAGFEAALDSGRVADAAALRRGPLLAGYEDDGNEAWSGWLAFERDRIGTAWRSAVLAYLSHDVPAAEALELCNQLLVADPLDEAALRAQMACLARDGQAAQARQVYRDFTARLAEDLGITPPQDLKALHDSLTAPAAAPAPSAPPRAADDGFVGRSVELRQITTLLGQPECRLVTLVGPGGVGKTRLARRAMFELSADYADGTAFVPLEDAGSAGDIATRIARELGVTPGRRDPFAAVVEYLRDRSMLLVLDNFEQVTAEASLLGTLLDQAPGVKLVVTSRARLGVPAEQLLPLEGLPVPDPEDQDHFDAFDSVRLFVKAARRVEPGLVPEAEAEAIADICRQVEGLPLALELAATWARVLSCEAIAAQLREGLQLLHSTDPTRPARHASMQVVFDESWRVLSAAERQALMCLSVFEGGFAPEAAQPVSGASLPVIASLVDKSLLRKDVGRLYMHPLLQQLALERLRHEGAEAEARRTHAAHFHRFMARLRDAATQGESAALRTIDRELSNCRAAWRWAARSGMSAALRGSLFTLLQFHDHRFRLEEGLALLSGALDSPATEADGYLAAMIRSTTAHLRYRLDRYPEAEAEALAALAATENGEAHDTRYQCVKVLGGCCLRTGRLEKAKQWYKQALKLAASSADPRGSAGMLDNLAIVEKRLGNYDEALRLSQQSLLEHRAVKDFAGETLTLNNLGTLCVDRREHDVARTYLQESLTLCDRHGLANTRAMVLANLGELEVATRRFDAAERYLREALPLSEKTPALECALRLNLSRIAAARREVDAARAELATGLEIAIAIGNRSYKHGSLLCFADLLIAQGETACAQAVLAFGIALPDIGAPERDAMREVLGEAKVKEPWSGPGIEELLRRIVLERDVAHAPLIQVLRGVTVPA